MAPALMSARLRDLISAFGQRALDFFERLGRSGIFLLQLVRGCLGYPFGMSLFFRQLFNVGVKTVSIVVVAAVFVGMVIALLVYSILIDFGSEEIVGLFVAVIVIRDLGPVLGTVLYTARVCSSLTAEVGSMKATEQLSGLEMMAADPFRYVYAPRFLAGAFANPLLCFIFITVAIWGAWLMAVAILGVPAGRFWTNIENGIQIDEEVLQGFVKACIFGITVTWIAIFEGHDSMPTAEGLGRATTSTVVNSTLAIFGLNLIITLFFFG